MKKIIFLALVTVLFITACKKDKNGPVVSERFQFLTTGQWKVSAYKNDSNSDGVFETDLYASIPSCRKDNFSVFKADGTIIVDEGPTKCDPGYSQTFLGDWRFADNENTIWINGGPRNIETFTSTILRITSISPGTGPGIFEEIYSRQ